MATALTRQNHLLPGVLILSKPLHPGIELGRGHRFRVGLPMATCSRWEGSLALSVFRQERNQQWLASKPAYVYMLRCADTTLYSGWTT
jgi:hypothetical protein